MESQFVTSIQDHLPVLSTAVILILAAFFFPQFQQLFSPDPYKRFPVWGKVIGDEEERRKHFLQHASKMQLDAYKQYKDVPYLMTSHTKTNMVIMPTRYLEELKRLPDDVLSFQASVERSLRKEFTGIPFDNDERLVPHTVRSDLTPALTRLNPIISDEVDRTVLDEVKVGDDWTAININKTLLRIVAIVSGRVFLGPELCRSEEYIEAAIDYTRELMGAVDEINAMKPSERKTKAPQLEKVKKIKAREEQVIRFLTPIIEARKAAKAAGDAPPDDVLAWVMDSQKYEVPDIRGIAQIQLGLSFAAIHTTTLTTTNVFYNLAVHPEYVTELRKELRDVLDEHDGVLTFTALQKLRKLDSFIKESMRMTPIGSIAFTRAVLKTVTLSDGTTLPAGADLAVPILSINRDPEIFENPDKFDAFRFSRMRDNEGSGGKHQFVSSTPDSLLFGYGRHACPGRFFAANEIKMIVARMVLNFDMRNKGGEKERYKNFEFGYSNVPDPTKELEMRTATG